MPTGIVHDAMQVPPSEQAARRRHRCRAATGETEWHGRHGEGADDEECWVADESGPRWRCPYCPLRRWHQANMRYHLREIHPAEMARAQGGETYDEDASAV